MSFFKLVMIVLLKIDTTKICLKAIRDTSFSNMQSLIREGTEEPKLLVGAYLEEGESSKFSLAGRGLNFLS